MTTKLTIAKTLSLLTIVVFGVLFINTSHVGLSIVPEQAYAVGDMNLNFGNLNLGNTVVDTPPADTTPSDPSVIAVTTDCNGGHCWNNSVTADKVCQMNGYDYAGSYRTTTVKLTGRFCSWASSSGGWWSCDYSCSSCSTSIGEVSCANTVIAPPAAPTLTSSGEGVVNVSSVTLTMTATDPQEYEIRYQIDKDANGSIDQYVPPSGYVPSGTSQQVVEPNTTVGSYPVRVRTENDKGLVSDWSADTVTVTNSAPPPPAITAFCAY